jgi:DNA-binding PadR family transcriptional regulator
MLIVSIVTRMDDLTATELIVLAAVSDSARYGYELVQRIQQITDGRVSIRPGNLYRVIGRLVDGGLVHELAPPPDVDERRRYFRATAQGRRVASAQLAMYSGVLRRVPILRDAVANG